MKSGKAFYWRCSERNGCGTVGLREDVLKPFIAETLGIPQFDDAEFERQIDHIDVLSASAVSYTHLHLLAKRMNQHFAVHTRQGGIPL